MQNSLPLYRTSLKLLVAVYDFESAERVDRVSKQFLDFSPIIDFGNNEVGEITLVFKKIPQKILVNLRRVYPDIFGDTLSQIVRLAGEEGMLNAVCKPNAEHVNAWL